MTRENNLSCRRCVLVELGVTNVIGQLHKLVTGSAKILHPCSFPRLRGASEDIAAVAWPNWASFNIAERRTA